MNRMEVFQAFGRGFPPLLQILQLLHILSMHEEHVQHVLERCLIPDESGAAEAVARLWSESRQPTVASHTWLLCQPGGRSRRNPESSSSRGSDAAPSHVGCQMFTRPCATARVEDDG